MKIRTDFVTNSSSSSFVIAFEKEHDFLNTFMELLCDVREGETDEGTILHTKEDLDKFYIEEYACFCNGSLEEFFAKYPSDKKEYDNILSILNEGKCILIKNISYHDTTLSMLISEMAETMSDKIKIINED